MKSDAAFFIPMNLSLSVFHVDLQTHQLSVSYHSMNFKTFNPSALRNVYNFGLSECNGVKMTVKWVLFC